MIVSFGDGATEDLYHGVESARARRFPADIVAAALRKLDMLEAAHDLRDLRSPPANRREALAGDWKGFHSVRVNHKWRIVFKWDEGAREVRLIDYH